MPCLLAARVTAPLPTISSFLVGLPRFVVKSTLKVRSEVNAQATRAMAHIAQPTGQLQYSLIGGVQCRSLRAMECSSEVERCALASGCLGKRPLEAIQPQHKKETHTRWCGRASGARV